MKPAVELYESREESRARWRSAFADRLERATALYREKSGRDLTHRDIAAMLRERAGRPVTPRLVGRWYQGAAEPRWELLALLSDILGVTHSWLAGWDETEKPQGHPARGVYQAENQLTLENGHGAVLATVKVAVGADVDAIIDKCYELLDLLHPDRPSLRVLRSAGVLSESPMAARAALALYVP